MVLDGVHGAVQQWWEQWWERSVCMPDVRCCTEASHSGRVLACVCSVGPHPTPIHQEVPSALVLLDLLQQQKVHLQHLLMQQLQLQDSVERQQPRCQRMLQQDLPVCLQR